MLQILRANTRIILWVIVVAFIGFIILVWGADLRFGSRRQGMLGTVNGQGISNQDFQRRLTARMQEIRSRGQRETSPEEERAAVDQTWESMVNELLIAQAAAKRGLPLSDGEVVYWVRSNPPEALRQEPAFTDSTGAFDVARYHEALRRAPEQFRWLEQYMRAQLPVTKLEQDVISAAKVSQAEVDTYVRDRYEQERASVVWVNPAAFPGVDLEVTEAQARAYYDAHPDEFQVDDRARLVVARVPKAASPEDEADVQDEVRGYSNSIARGEATFAALAESFSQDAFAEQGGDHGAARRRVEIEPELADRVFSVPVGQVSDVFRIGNRVLLVHVLADSTIEGQPARRFATIERRIEPGRDRLTEIRNQVQDIYKRAHHQGLAAAARAVQVKVDTTGFIERNGFSPQLGDVREAIDFAFEHPAGTLGNPVETSRDFVLYQVIERRKAEVLPIEEALPSARRLVQRSRQHELARAKADSLMAAYRSTGDIAAAARTVGLGVRDTQRFTRKGGIPGVTRDPEVISAAFSLPAGKVSNLIETKSGFFLVRADSLFSVTGPELERQRTAARRNLEFERQRQVFQNWLAELRADADVQDHRQAMF